jgi:acetylglutamate kinase
VSRSADGGIYNVNADLAASELAKALRCEHLIYVTDVDGVLLDGRVAHEIRTGDIERLAAEKYVTGGMLPKIRSAAEAVTSGVGHVHICGWHGEGTLIDELAAETRHGTVIF